MTLTQDQQEATLVIIMVSQGYDIEKAEEFSRNVPASALSSEVMRRFMLLSDSDKRGVLTLVTKRVH